MKSKYIQNVLIFRHFTLNFHTTYATLPAEQVLVQRYRTLLQVLEDEGFI